MLNSSDPHIEYSLKNGVFRLKINRPNKKNALLPSMYRSLATGLSLADSMEEATVILITGVDDCFTSGNDVNGFIAATESKESGADQPSKMLMHALNETRKPIVAAISGLAIGIGTTLLMHCDLIYASENCFLQLPFTRLGLCPEAGSSLLLPKQIGHQRASELLLLGDRISAKKAYEYGLVNEVLPQSDYLEYAIQKANQLAALPSKSVQTSKRLLKKTAIAETRTVINEELIEFAALLKTPEAQEIVQSFIDRSASRKSG
jgi:enoyl-CoA hydratase/carnithine racemase